MDIELPLSLPARYTHCGRPQLEQAVNLEEDNSLPVVDHLLEADIRCDVPLLPSFCSTIMKLCAREWLFLLWKSEMNSNPHLVGLQAERGSRMTDRLAPLGGSTVFLSRRWYV